MMLMDISYRNPILCRPGFSRQDETVFEDANGRVVDQAGYQYAIHHNEQLEQAIERASRLSAATFAAASEASDAAKLEVIKELDSDGESLSRLVVRAFELNPPQSIRLPHHICHVALTSRLLSVPTSAATLESRVAG